ncbi:MAG: hypothetical protein R3B09_14785 [Nannocystaceae bacterium]
MSDARTIAPDRRRLDEADRAGLRRRPRWLTRGLVALALAALLEPAAAIVPGVLAHGGDLGALWRDLGMLWVALLLAVIAAVVAASAASGTLGAVDRGRLRRLGAVDEHRTPGLVILAIIVAAALLLVDRGVIAGGARAVDAAAAGLTALWIGWLTRVLRVGGGLLVAAGFAELILDEIGRRRALYRSLDEVREELRERG